MSAEILRRISDRYQTAVAFHKESADLFHFLGLTGFAKLHEYQALDEFKTSRELKLYIIETHSMYFPDAEPESPNILVPLLKQHERFTLTQNQGQDIVKRAMSAYKKWETDTKAMYEEAAAELLSEGSMTDYIFVAKLVEDVSKELIEINDLLLDLKLTDFDMPHVADIQSDLDNKFSQLLLDLFLSNQKYPA